MEAIISNVQWPWYLIDTTSPEILYWYKVKLVPLGTLVNAQLRLNECSPWGASPQLAPAVFPGFGRSGREGDVRRREYTPHNPRASRRRLVLFANNA